MRWNLVLLARRFGSGRCAEKASIGLVSPSMDPCYFASSVKVGDAQGQATGPEQACSSCDALLCKKQRLRALLPLRVAVCEGRGADRAWGRKGGCSVAAAQRSIPFRARGPRIANFAAPALSDVSHGSCTVVDDVRRLRPRLSRIQKVMLGGAQGRGHIAPEVQSNRTAKRVSP